VETLLDIKEINWFYLVQRIRGSRCPRNFYQFIAKIRQDKDPVKEEKINSEHIP
jgi:hypothetical protein